MAKIEYHKLVRDKIPQIIEENGKTCKTRLLRENEYRDFLAEKLVEEAKEFLESREKEELADLIEVYESLLSAYGFSETEIKGIQAKKRNERGSFSERTLLESVEDGK